MYGGTFDPIHFGHMNLAIDLMEAHSLKEIWLCPALLNPLKPSSHSSFFHRLNMLKLIVEEMPQWKVIDIEGKRSAPSYTIDTIEELLRSSHLSPLSLLLGDDSVEDFFRWHRAKEIVELVPLFVGRRKLVSPLKSLKGDPEIIRAIRDGWTDTHIVDISSTEIRKRIKEGKWCGHLVPSKILKYIEKNQLYR